MKNCLNPQLCGIGMDCTPCYEKEVESLVTQLDFVKNNFRRQIELRDIAQLQVKDLQKFCRAILSNDDIDMDDLQQMAVGHGLLEEVTKTKPCCSDREDHLEGICTCKCHEFFSDEDFANGITCLHHTNLLRGLRQSDERANESKD